MRHRVYLTLLTNSSGILSHSKITSIIGDVLKKFLPPGLLVDFIKRSLGKLISSKEAYF
jgi:hypothetical protein